MRNRSLISALCCGLLNCSFNYILKAVMAEEVCGLETWSLSPTLCFLHQHTRLKTILLLVLWDLLLRCWGGPSSSPPTSVQLFPCSSIYQLPPETQCELLAPAQLSTTWSHSPNAPFVYFFSKAVFHLPLYSICGTSHAQVLPCSCLPWSGLGWVL